MIEPAQSQVSLASSERPAVSLGTRLSEARDYERQRALRTLLQQPLLSADGPYAVEFGLVRQHAEWLRDWLAQNTGWALQVDSELARLRKTPADVTDDTRAARDVKTGVPFTRRRYVLLCLALAALERSDRQTALGKLADDIVGLLAADPAFLAAGIIFDLSSRDQRRDLVQVIRFLLDLRVLARMHGDEEQYLNDRGDVLYNINRPALAAILNVKRGPSTISSSTLDERLSALVEEPLPDTEEGRNRGLRWGLVRKLLDDPVVYYDNLRDEELAYLHSQRGRLLRQIEDGTGLTSEVRREGIAMVDERTELTDLGMPEEGTDGHLALLLAEHLAEHLRLAESVAVGSSALHQYVRGLIAQHRSHWRKDVVQPGAEVAASDQTIDRLESLRLVKRTEDGVLPLPAIARYALDGVREASANEDGSE